MNEDTIERFTPWGTPIKELNEELQAIFDDEKGTDEEANEEDAPTGDEAPEAQAEASRTGASSEAKGAGSGPSNRVHPGSFNDLKPCNASIVRSATGTDGDEVSVSFENLDGELDLLVDNGCCVTPVLFLRMKGKELHVGSTDNDWHVFRLKRPSTDWSKQLPDNVLVEVST